MTTRAEIEHAAFWDEELCLDCGETERLDDGVHCDVCGSSNILPGKVALRLIVIAEEWEDGEAP